MQLQWSILCSHFIVLSSFIHLFTKLVQYLLPTASPPKTLTLDEVMKSARDLSNLSIAHEIVVNRNFHLEPNSLPQDRYIMKTFSHTLIMFCGFYQWGRVCKLQCQYQYQCP